MQNRRLAGLSGVVFGVGALAAVIIGNAPGGEYHTDEVAAFVAKDHGSAVLASLIVMLVASVALLWLGAFFREDAFSNVTTARLFSSLVIGSAVSFLGGYTVLVTPSTSQALGGGPVIDPAVTYTMLQQGWGVLLFGGGTFLAVALLTLAFAGKTEPMWVRVFAAVAGVGGIASIALFFLLLLEFIFALAVGVWLLASKARS